MGKVTIVTPTYNEEAKIGDYLDSLTRQTYQDFDLMIVDDGSTDRTVEIVQRYCDRLRIQLVKMPHLGWKAAKARGTAAVTTEYLIVNDADCIVDAHCVEYIMDAFSDPAVEVVGGRTLSRGDNWVLQASQLVRHIVHRYRKGASSRGWVLTGACMAFRTETLRAVGGLLETDELVGQDIEISWRLQRYGIGVMTRDDAIVYHQDPHTLAGVYRRQYLFGRKAVYTYWLYKNLWGNWKLWVRFYPLAILLAALVSVRAALALLAATYAGTLWLLRNQQTSFVKKSQAWLLLTIYCVAYTAGFITQSIRFIGRKRTAP